MQRSTRSNPRPPRKPDASVSAPSTALPVASVRFAFEAIGTHWTIELYEPLAAGAQRTLLATIKARIEAFDRSYSRFRPDSLVTKMSQKPGTHRLPADAAPMFALYHELYQVTGGLMTPLVGQLLSDAGYDAQYSFQPGQLRAVPAWDDVLTLDFPHLTLKKPALLDVGAAGKGYLVDLVASAIAGTGVQAFCVDAGGDMAYRNLHADAPSLAIGLEHPENPEQIIGVAQLMPGSSLCGSAGNRRAWQNFHHIINPRTRSSPQHIRALWVMTETTMLADALTTALFFVPALELQKRYTFEYALVRSDYSLEYSAGFPATFFTEEKS